MFTCKSLRHLASFLFTGIIFEQYIYIAHSLFLLSEQNIVEYGS